MEPEKIAYELFTDALPHYFETHDEYPDDIKFRLAINGYGSCWEACLDIANHVLTTPKLKRNACKELSHIQSVGGKIMINAQVLSGGTTWNSVNL